LGLPFSIANTDGWNKTLEANTDGYGAAGLRYAARWANYMEKEIANGNQLSDIAEQTSSEADKEGITGFQYGCALSILTQVWAHGAELKKWKEAQR